MLFININDGHALFQLQRKLEDNIPIVILLDELSSYKKVAKNKKRFIEFTINGKIGAVIPINIFTIAEKTKATMVPIANIRTGVYNDLTIYEPISFEEKNIVYAVNTIYALLFSLLKKYPENFEMYTWKLFTDYVADKSTIENVDIVFSLFDYYKHRDSNTIYFHNKIDDNYFLLKLENYRVIKVDELTVKIINWIKKKNRIPKKYAEGNEKVLLPRIEYLLKTGFIEKINHDESQ